MAFAKRLKAARENRKALDPKWTQGYVADLIGVARPTYTAYEAGTKQPPMETINRISALFNVSTDYLHGRTNDPSPPREQEKLLDGLSREEQTVLEQIRKHPKAKAFFSDLASDPGRKVKKLIKMWDAVINDIENDKDEEPKD